MGCDDCGCCPTCNEELTPTLFGYGCTWCGTQLHMQREDLPRFEEDPDRRPYIWDLEED